MCLFPSLAKAFPESGTEGEKEKDCGGMELQRMNRDDGSIPIMMVIDYS